MNKQKFICKKCGCTEYIVKEKPNGTGVATGLYCAKCGTWQKWLNKQEKVLYNSELVGKQDGEQETRKKIIKVLDRAALSFHEYFRAQVKNAFENGAKHYSNKDCDKSIYDFWADALIAAGIGDVKEAETERKAYEVTSNHYRTQYEEQKHRAEVAERAFGNCIENFVKFQYEQNGYQLDKFFLDEVSKKCLKQAEKELQEERKDG